MTPLGSKERLTSSQRPGAKNSMKICMFRSHVISQILTGNILKNISIEFQRYIYFQCNRQSWIAFNVLYSNLTILVLLSFADLKFFFGLLYACIRKYNYVNCFQRYRRYAKYKNQIEQEAPGGETFLQQMGLLLHDQLDLIYTVVVNVPSL